MRPGREGIGDRFGGRGRRGGGARGAARALPLVLLVAAFSGDALAGWTSLGVSESGILPGAASLASGAPRVAVDSKGRPHVAWQVGTKGNFEVLYAFWDRGKWKGVGGSESGGGVSRNEGGSYLPSLALDALDRPHIAWEDDSSGSTEIYYSFWDGTAWAGPSGARDGGGVSATPGSSHRPNLALDSKGNPQIVWEDDTGGAFRIRYARWDGTAWRGADGADPRPLELSNPGSVHPSLALDSKDRPHLVWEEPRGSTTNVKYAYWDGGSWVGYRDGAGRVNEGPGSAIDPTIVVDSTGRPHVAWADDSDGDSEIHYAYLDGLPWKGIGGSAGRGGITHNNMASYHPSLALDREGRPHVAWEETGSGNVEIDYAYWDGSRWDRLGRPEHLGGVSRTPGASLNPVLALDPDGWPHFVWEEGTVEGQGVRHCFYRGRHPVALWGWEDGLDGARDPAVRRRLTPYCVEKKIGTVFVPFRPGAEEGLADLLASLHREGIQVHAQAPRALTTLRCVKGLEGRNLIDEESLMQWATSLRAFNEKGEGFDGYLVWFIPDSEETGCDSPWKKRGRGGPDPSADSMARAFLDAAQHSKAMLGSSLVAGIAVADNVARSGLDLEYEGKRARLLSHLRAASDLVVLMNLRGDNCGRFFRGNPFQARLPRADAAMDSPAGNVILGARLSCSRTWGSIFRFVERKAFDEDVERALVKHRDDPAFGGVAVTSFAQIEPQLFGRPVKAVWLWSEGEEPLVDRPSIARAVAFLREKGVGRAFFPFAGGLDGRTGLLVRALHAAGMEAHAVAPSPVAGGACRGDPSGQPAVDGAALVEWAESVSAFQEVQEERLDGALVPFDPTLVPAGCGRDAKAGAPGGPEARPGKLATSFLDSISRARQVLRAKGIALGVSMPKYLDGKARDLEYAGSRKRLSRFIQDSTDYVILTDPRKDPCGRFFGKGAFADAFEGEMSPSGPYDSAERVVLVEAKLGCLGSTGDIFRFTSEESFEKETQRLLESVGVAVRGYAEYAPRRGGAWVNRLDVDSMGELKDRQADILFVPTEGGAEPGAVRFVSAANEKGWDVHAVMPEGLWEDWCRRDQTGAVKLDDSKILEWMRSLAAAKEEPSSWFGGVMLGFEPRVLGACWQAGSDPYATDPNRATAKAFLDLLGRSGEITRKSGFKLGAAIPSGFTERETGMFTKDQEILSHRVQDATEYIFVKQGEDLDCAKMDKWVLFSLEGEVRRAAKTGKDVFVWAGDACHGGHGLEEKNGRALRKRVDEELRRLRGYGSFGGLVYPGQKATFEDGIGNVSGERIPLPQRAGGEGAGH